MARLFTIQSGKTYASEENAIKAVEKKFPESANDGLMYFLARTEDGRFFPVFTGGERATQQGVHFSFHVV